MARSIRFFALGLGLLAAACQPAPSPSGAIAPSGTPSAAASQAPTASTSSAPVASARPAAPSTPPSAAQLVTLSGQVFDDLQGPIDGAAVDASSPDAPGIAQTLKVVGGAYVLPGVPVGATVTLKAYKDGYDARIRTVKAVALPPESDIDYNKFDFGGTGEGKYYALFAYPDITSVTPATKSTGVTPGPLDLVFTFSNPLNADARGAFERIVQVDFPLSYDQTGNLTHALLTVGTPYDNKTASMTWDASGRTATFHFDGPLVSRPNAYAGPMAIRMNPNAGISVYPKVQGQPLGRDVAPLTYEGGGFAVSNQIAPFLRPTLDPIATPSPLPTGLALWGLTHMTNSTFSLAQDTSVPRVTSVVAQSGSSGLPDRFVVTFDHPMRAFPEAALDGSAVATGSYRYVLGTRNKPSDVQAFASADPSAGQSIAQSPTYSTTANNVIYVPLPSGTFSGYSDFKFYINPQVKDAAGMTIKSSIPDPTTHLADNAIQGTIQ